MSNKGETDMTNSQNTKILAHLRATKGLTLREAMLDYSIQSQGAYPSRHQCDTQPCVAQRYA